MLELTALLVLGNGSVSNWDVQKQAYFSILDCVVGEITTASFWGSNLALLEVVGSLLQSSKASMQPAAVKLLTDPLQQSAVRDDGGRIECGRCLSPEETALTFNFGDRDKRNAAVQGRFPRHNYTRCMQLL